MKNLIIISGVSGAGKTTASNYFEDKGYNCIDQYPVELLEDLINLIQQDETIKYQNVVLTIPIIDLEKCEALLNNTELKPTLLLVDADRDEIINRYKFTRRVHPLLVKNVASTLKEAVDIEKNILNKFNKKGVRVLNTTHLSHKEHYQKLDKLIKVNEDSNISISFVSFGFKNGIPEDADNVFDVRFLDNPYYDPKLKKKTGKDKAVKDFVLNSKNTQSYIKKLIAYVDIMLKQYSKEEKRHLTIAVGCTGGQHRSVVIANYLFNHYKDKYNCYIRHREIDK